MRKPECKYIVKWLLWLKMIYEIDIKSKRIYNGVCGCQWTQKDHCGRQKFEGHYPNVILIIKYCFTIKEFQWKTEMSALDMTVLKLLYVTSYYNYIWVIKTTTVTTFAFYIMHVNLDSELSALWQMIWNEESFFYLEIYFYGRIFNKGS